MSLKSRVDKLLETAPLAGHAAVAVFRPVRNGDGQETGVELLRTYPPGSAIVEDSPCKVYIFDRDEEV
jgi:hypothetical protein